MMQLCRIALFLLFASPLNANLNVEVKSSSALLINAVNGKVLFAKNSDKIMNPASCTKLAFALYAIKFHKELFNKTLVCSFNALKALPESQKCKNNFGDAASYILETDASHMGLKVGEELTFYELLVATMVISADDASNVIAEAMGNGSIERCVEEVNRFVRSLGCKNTHFTNPHGLYHPDHVSTAEDLALLCQAAMKEPLLREMVKKASYVRPKTNKQESVPLKPTNRLLIKSSPYYSPYVVGVKTGYHRRAGCCLIAQAEKDGRSLISVTLQATSGERFKDTLNLFEAAFQEKRVKRTLFSAGPLSCSRKIPGSDQLLTTYSQDPLTLIYYPSEEPKISCRLIWDKVALPVKKGMAVGELELYTDDVCVKKVKFYAENDLKMTLLYSLKQHRQLILVGMIGLVVLALLVLFRKNRVAHR